MAAILPPARPAGNHDFRPLPGADVAARAPGHPPPRGARLALARRHRPVLARGHGEGQACASPHLASSRSTAWSTTGGPTSWGSAPPTRCAVSSDATRSARRSGSASTCSRTASTPSGPGESGSSGSTPLSPSGADAAAGSRLAAERPARAVLAALRAGLPTAAFEGPLRAVHGARKVGTHHGLWRARFADVLDRLRERRRWQQVPEDDVAVGEDAAPLQPRDAVAGGGVGGAGVGVRDHIRVVAVIDRGVVVGGAGDHARGLFVVLADRPVAQLARGIRWLAGSGVRERRRFAVDH